jgi:hypothetical protein
LDDAERVARGIGSGFQRGVAVAAVARGAAAAGDAERALRLLNREQPLSTVLRTDPGGPESDDPGPADLSHLGLRAEVVAAAADHGLLREAEGIAGLIVDPAVRAPALMVVAAAASGRAHYRRRHRVLSAVERTIASIEPAPVRVDALLAVLDLMPARYAAASATRFLDAAQAAARALAEPERRAAALLGVVRAAHRLRAPDLVVGQLDEARRAVAPLTGDAHDPALLRVALTAEAVGQPDLAERHAGQLIRGYGRVDALASLGEGRLARSRDEARRLMLKAERAAGQLTSPSRRAGGLARVAHLAARLPDHRHAARLVEAAERASAEITVDTALAAVLTEIAVAAVATGDAERGAHLLDRAATVAAGLSDKHVRTMAFSGLARGALATGSLDLAQSHARSISGPRRWQVLVEIAGAAASYGEDERAVDLFEQAAKAAATSTNDSARGHALATVARAAAAAGLIEDSERIAGMAYRHRDAGLADVVRFAAASGRRDVAERIAGAMAGGPARWDAVGEVVRAAMAAGERDRAVRALAAAFRDGAHGRIADLTILVEPRAARMVLDTVAQIQRYASD